MSVEKGTRSAGQKAAPIRARRPRNAGVDKRTIFDSTHRWSVVFLVVTAAFAVWSALNPL